jgi:hypothetical protein
VLAHEADQAMDILENAEAILDIDGLTLEQLGGDGGIELEPLDACGHEELPVGRTELVDFALDHASDGFRKVALKVRDGGEVMGEIVTEKEGECYFAADASSLKLKLDLPEGMLAAQKIGRAVGEDDEERPGGTSAAEVSEHVDAGRIGPVNIIKKDDKGSAAGHLVEKDA